MVVGSIRIIGLFLTSDSRIETNAQFQFFRHAVKKILAITDLGSQFLCETQLYFITTGARVWYN